ncbi:MAG: hypothetical protein RLZZ519_2349, partial [Bacteroidota bacterium]
ADRLSFQTGEVEGIEGLFSKHPTCAYDYALLDFSKQEGAVFLRRNFREERYHVGSLGKVIVAIGILKLAEQGRLKLDDPVSIHLPALEMPNDWNATDPVRIVHLLEHSAGLDDMHFNEFFLNGDAKIPLGTALARNPASKRIRWRPGTRSAYSNVGYAIAASIIESITKEEADSWLKQNVLLPMGMQDSYFDRGESTNQPVVKGCAGLSLVRSRSYLYYPAVGFVTTARDMGRLLAFLAGNGSVGSDTVLQPASVARMMRSETTLAADRGWYDGDYGLGVRIWGDRNFQRIVVNGYVEGFVSQMEFYPETKSGWVLMGTDVLDRGGYLSEMQQIFADHLGQERHSVSLPANAPSPTPGWYRFANSRNGYMDFEHHLMANLYIVDHGDDQNGRWWGRLSGNEPFVLEFEAAHSEFLANDPPHFKTFAGKTAEGTDFLVIEGKYFERERHSTGLIRGFFRIFSWLVILFSILVPLIGFFQRRWSWLKGNFSLAWMVVLPNWLGYAGYSMLTSENYAGLGQIGLFSLLLATISCLIPVFALLSVVALFRKWPSGRGRYLRIAWLPLIAGNIGLTIYLAAFGMIPFFSWAY